MSTTKETTQAVAKKEERAVMEYVPFGSQDRIRLSCSIVRRLIAVPTTSGKLPTDDDCIKFQMMCQAKRLNPFEGDAFMIGYDTKNGPKFSQITAHQVFLKRAEVSPEYDGMESGVIVFRDEQMIDLEGDFMLDDDKLVGAWAKVYFKNRSHPMHKRVKLSTFDKGTNQWASNKAGMIVKCAEADALRSSFPNLLGSLYTREETVDLQAEAPRITAPIFKNEVKAIEEAPVIQQEPPSKHAELVETLDAMVVRDGVDLAELIPLLQASGLAGDAMIKLEDLSEEDIKLTMNSWPTLLKQLKPQSK